MTPPVPQNQQLEALLDFLYEAMRVDAKLIQWLCTDQVTPDLGEIITATVEHNPFEMRPGEGGRLMPTLIYDQDLPLLACWEKSSEFDWSGKVWGELCQLQMLYIFRSYPGDENLSPQAWNARISKDVSWQIGKLLRRHTLTGWGTTGDLYTDGNIRDIVLGKITRLSSEEHEGFLMDLQLLHYAPPYAEDAAGTFLTIDLEVHEDDEIPADDGVIVKATLDATPSS